MLNNGLLLGVVVIIMLLWVIVLFWLCVMLIVYCLMKCDLNVGFGLLLMFMYCIVYCCGSSWSV